MMKRRRSGSKRHQIWTFISARNLYERFGLCRLDSEHCGGNGQGGEGGEREKEEEEAIKMNKNV